MLNLSYVAILLALSMSVLCLPTGPNPKKDEHHHGNIMETTCESMSPPVGPGHPNPPVQTPAAPYTIEVSKRDVGTGERLQITLSGQNEENKFKGILVQARRAGSADIVAVGKFIIGTSGDGQLINCAPGNENSFFYRSREPIHSFTIDWQAPDSWNGDDVHIVATFVKSKTETWLNVSSETFKIISA